MTCLHVRGVFLLLKSRVEHDREAQTLGLAHQSEHAGTLLQRFTAEDGDAFKAAVSRFKFVNE